MVYGVDWFLNIYDNFDNLDASYVPMPVYIYAGPDENDNLQQKPKIQDLRGGDRYQQKH